MSEAPRLPNPALLMQIALAHRSSAVLFAAADLDLFTALAGGAKTAAEVAWSCGAKPEPVRFLPEACVAEGLLAREGDGFANTPVVDAYPVLCPPPYTPNTFKY